MEQLDATTGREQLKTNRGLFKWLIFTALTLGIYSLYTIHAIAHDVNLSCAKDGKTTHGLLLYILLTVITFGIYSIVWNVTVCNRMRDRIESSGGSADVSGLSWFLWSTFGMVLFGLGGLIAEYKLLHALNHTNELYNQGK